MKLRIKETQGKNLEQFLSLLQVLIAAHQPPYELRHNQMENIFLSAVDMYGHDFCPESLQVSIIVVYDITTGNEFGSEEAVHSSMTVSLREGKQFLFLKTIDHCRMESGTRKDIFSP